MDDELPETLSAWQQALSARQLSLAQSYAQSALDLLHAGHPWPRTRPLMPFIHWCRAQGLATEDADS